MPKGGIGRKILRRITLPRVDKDPARFQTALTLLLGEMAEQINGLAEGRLEAHYNSAASAFPATGWGLGDFQKNSAPAEVSATLPASTKWVLSGWTCTDQDTQQMSPAYTLVSLT